MRKLLVAALVCIGMAAFGQAKKPTLMVVPSDVWCNTNGYMTEFDIQGTTRLFPDYRKAFQSDPNLLLAISKINEIMAGRGFPLKNLESAMKSVESNSIEESLTTSRFGAEAVETPLDKIKATAKADIILQLTYTINNTGPKRSVTFNLQGLDSYTDKQIAAASGTGQPSFAAELPVLLEEAVLSYMDNFAFSLQSYFEDLFENGREVTVRAKVWDDWGEDFYSYFGGNDDELGIIIEDYMADNTVEGRFSTTDATDFTMVFEQVRIPLYYERNGRQRAMDTRTFANNLARFLRDNFEIESRVVTKGLGQVTIYLGSK